MITLAPERAAELAARLLDLAQAEDTPPDKLLKSRQLLEQLYKSLTDNVKLSFSGLFARMQYVHEQTSTPSDLVTQANVLRILANKIAHEEHVTCSMEDFNSAVSLIYALLKSFCSAFSSLSLDEYIASSEARPFARPQDSRKLSFSCMVQQWKKVENSSGTALEIVAITEDGEACCIFLRDDNTQKGHEGRLYSILAKSLWQYAVLMCHNLSEASGKQGSYTSNPQTLIVLEPDFLIDASSLAECFSSSRGNPLVFLLNRLLSDSSTEAMIQGTIVNGIFDQLFFNPQANYTELFKAAMRQMPIAMVALGKQSCQQVYNRIRDEHLDTLKQYCQSDQADELLLEPNFICPDYGLQGRLDLLQHAQGKYQIVELKSGQAPAQDIWSAHHMQAMAYNMIICKALGADNTGNTAIFYSADKKSPLRHVVTVVQLEQDLMSCRNRIIGILHTLSEHPAIIFDWLLKQEDIGGNKFLKDKLVRLQNLLHGLENYEYEWFLEQVKRCVREIWFVKTGNHSQPDNNGHGFNSLWQDSIPEKQAAYKLISGMTPLSSTSNLIRFALPPMDSVSDFREGDIVVLYRHHIRVINQEILRGSIVRLSKHDVEISIRGGVKHHNGLGSDVEWVMEHDLLDTSLYSPLQSLTRFIAGEPSLRRRVLGLHLPKPIPTNPEETSIGEVIARMHQADDLFIVQGPPGTGKTSGLLGNYVKQVFEQSSKKLLITSFTNRAVDEICLCLERQGVTFIRTGNSAQINSRLLSNLVAGKSFEEMEQTIKGNRIWIATVQSAIAWYQELLRLVNIDELIIDEASQIIETGVLGLMSRIPKTILIGDQNQLPPICVQSDIPYAFSSPELQSLGYTSYHQSLMERLHKTFSSQGAQSNLAMLQTHYRMHEDIARLTSGVYQNKLACGTDRQIKPLISDPSLPAMFHSRLLWIDCPPSNILHYDPSQVELVLAMIDMFHAVWPQLPLGNDIGIIVPFRAMIHALRKQLPDYAQEITIDTVERFQGSERNIIILCLPLRYPSCLKQVESLSDNGRVDRKLNVAVSRAKERLIVLGNSSICRNSIHYSSMLDQFSSHGLVVDSALARQELMI